TDDVGHLIGIRVDEVGELAQDRRAFVQRRLLPRQERLMGAVDVRGNLLDGNGGELLLDLTGVGIGDSELAHGTSFHGLTICALYQTIVSGHSATLVSTPGTRAAGPMVRTPAVRRLSRRPVR